MPTPASLFQRLRKPLLRIFLILFLAWLGLVVLAALFYPRLVYHPTVQLLDIIPTQVGAASYEDLWLTASDGVRLNAWFVPGDKGRESGYTLLVFHGNAGNLSTAAHRIRIYNRIGLDVFMVDYHGFGKSGGSPDEQALYRDADAAWKYLVEEKKVEPGRIIIFGYSLGGAVAAYTAEKHADAAGLVLESTFTSLADVAAHHFPYLPCRLIVGNAFDTRARLENIRMPLLVIHGRGDELVPFSFGEQVYTGFSGEKRFVRIGDDHNLGYLSAEDSYRDGIVSYMDSLESNQR